MCPSRGFSDAASTATSVIIFAFIAIAVFAYVEEQPLTYDYLLSVVKGFLGVKSTGPKPKKLIIGVLSAQSNFQPRQVVRDTWGRLLAQEKVDLKFIIGSKFCEVPSVDRVTPYVCEEWTPVLPKDNSIINNLAFASREYVGKSYVGFTFIIKQNVSVVQLSVSSNLLSSANRIARVVIIDASYNKIVTSATFAFDPEANVRHLRTKNVPPVRLPIHFEGEFRIISSVPNFSCPFELKLPSAVHVFEVFDSRGQYFPFSNERDHYSICGGLAYNVENADLWESQLKTKTSRLENLNKSQESLKCHLAAENSTYGDILFAEVVDVYANLMWKTIFFLNCSFSVFCILYRENQDKWRYSFVLILRQVQQTIPSWRPNPINDLSVASKMSGSGASKTKIDVLLQKFVVVLNTIKKSHNRPIPMLGCADTYSILLKNKLLPQVKVKAKKSDEKSEKIRATGDKAFIAQYFEEARRNYTSAICCAKPEGESIALAYASRSAVHFELQAHSDAINDINHALATGKYPIEKHHVLYERRARSYLGLSQYSKALADAKKVVCHVINGNKDKENVISDLTILKDQEKVISLLTDDEPNQEKVDRLKSLIEIIAKCVDKTDVPQLDPIEPKLSHERSENIKGAFCAMELATSPKMGRHMVATTDISPGDILAVEKPVVSILKPAFYDSFCDNCKMRCNSSIPCLTCNHVVFCSERCRLVSWESHHSIECDILPTFIDLGLKLHALNAVRAFLVATKCGRDLEGQSDNQDYHAINNLATHEKYRLRPKIIAMASCVLHILIKATKLFDKSVVGTSTIGCQEPLLNLNHILAGNFIAKCLKMVPYNAFDIGESSLTPSMDFDFTLVGGALYSTLCLINHSCDPNVFVYLFDEQTRVIVAVKPIKKGEQIFVTYGPMFIHQALDERQKELKTKYLFDCKCDPCFYDWPIWSELKDIPTFVSDAHPDLRADIMNSINEIHELWRAVENGPITEEQSTTMLQYLSIYDKWVERPWRYHYVAEEIIKKQFNFKQKYVVGKQQEGSMSPFCNIFIVFCLVVVVGIHLLILVDEQTLTQLAPQYLLSFAPRSQSSIMA